MTVDSSGLRHGSALIKQHTPGNGLGGTFRVSTGLSHTATPNPDSAVLNNDASSAEVVAALHSLTPWAHAQLEATRRGPDLEGG